MLPTQKSWLLTRGTSPLNQCVCFHKSEANMYYHYQSRPHSLCHAVQDESEQISLRITRSPVLVASLSLWVSLTQKSRLFTHCTPVFEQMCLFSRI